ncbi:hypothetical protein ACOBWA_01250 [Psychrobacter sp. ER1]|uniref:hypothetical protein n=1 Tax=Psychrobacter sp. ER1 TaxID=3406645 RepID=UPI003B432D85
MASNFINFGVLLILNQAREDSVMRKVFIAAGYILIALKLICMPAQASSDGDYRESVQVQQYEDEDDLSIFELALIAACVVGASYWLRFK